ncbi:MAG: acyl--CoA ligase [Cyanobacteria bacterium REEB65]|nr:acyl--CoA ligase [Cyanobacteria bacterium REEB65]
MSTLLAQAAANWADRPALRDGEGALTYRQLSERVEAAARDLACSGIRSGDFVGLLGLNSRAYIVEYLALGAIEAVALPLNFRLADAELLWQLRRVGARCVLSDAALADRQLPGFHVLPMAGAGGQNLSPLPELEEFGSAPPSDARTIFFTSGTTGKPKGALFDQGRLIASARSVGVALNLESSDRWLLCLPLFHVGGLAIVHRMLACGGCVVVSSKFTPASFAAAVADHHPTRVSLTPSMLRQLQLRDPRLTREIRTILLGGEAISPDLLLHCPNALASYGLTEAGSTVAIADPGRLCLRPLPGFEVRITTADGRPCGPRELGQLSVRGSALMTSYLGMANQDDWFETGDLAEPTDTGGFVVRARRDDLILSGGENVYPAEVEAALLEHPGIQATVVAGIADPQWGQVPVAAIVPQLSPLTPRQLEAHLRERLAGYKIPRRWAFVAQLPTLGSGKVDRRAVCTLF